MPTLEVIALIYKSTEYLRFIEDQMLRFCKDFDDVKVSCRIVANDPTTPVIAELKNLKIPYTIYNDKNPDEYYINRVYRCLNHAGFTSESNLVCLCNSDMAFSPDWLEPLYELHNQGYLPVSRLVESGKLDSHGRAVSKDFGKNPKDFRQSEWLNFANSIRKKKISHGGLFVPVLLDREEFILTGMYPEGHIYQDGVGTRNGAPVEMGDVQFFKTMKDVLGREHATCFESLVYHIQEGEMDE